MATLSDGRIHIETAAGARVSGGFLRLYEYGTTNLADVFADEDLTVPLDNPVEADSNGICPQIFGAEGLVVECAKLTAEGALIPDSDFIMTFTGSTETGADYDFGTSRLAISGSAGVAQIEAGNADGDDTGGSLRIGGWDDSQGDDLELDFATINTTGRFTENGKKLDGVVATPATSFAAAASVSIQLPNVPTGVLAWEVDIWELTNTTASETQLRFAYDSVPTFKSGASDYAYSYELNATVTESAAANHIRITSGQTASGKTHWTRFIILAPASGSEATKVIGDAISWGSGPSGLPRRMSFNGACIGGFGTPTYIQLVPNAGTIAGKYRIRPLRGFGE